MVSLKADRGVRTAMNKVKLKKICQDSFAKAETSALDAAKEYYIQSLAEELREACSVIKYGKALQTNLSISLMELLEDSFDELTKQK